MLEPIIGLLSLIPPCVTTERCGLSMLFKVNRLCCACVSNTVSKSFMSIEYARQLRLTYSTREAVIHRGDTKDGVALSVCPVIFRTVSGTTKWVIRVLGLLTEYDECLGNNWSKRPQGHYQLGK